MAQYHVNLSFSADASRAKAQLKDLQNQLTNLINTPQSKLGIEGEINNAIKAAAELKAHLQAATNVKTGNLDFSKLSQSLKQSNTTLTQYATKLQQLGPAGQQAFMTLAQSVAQAEIPIRRSSAALDKMWETLKNTARWQVSSTVLHGFMGAVQSAYGYAQDLNKSLNDIRIVTGQNTDQMAKFAKEANKAAKALSTSTTNYTKASLIYYQQGLNDQQVKERTDITVKMANVARSSAEDVSDQLTAVWNNFYDGSKSLEHYADVMTALGAATASSTDEISEGLNKFAAVAETVGLSYEYAASALATVTATTRQSADIVGNAFKTLFARIQGLKLGETLDDGTTLNKYSQALDAVGIKIKGVNGEIKDMDVILNELGTKWDTLGKDQQIALAQTVAGVRQYTQLIALMDNWDYFQENLGVANSSTGTLQEQADIYAESWEAASKRVEAAAQSIYEKLMNDDFFIDLLNSLEKVLNFTDNLIDSMGGLKGVLMTLSTVATKLFADKMAQGFSNFAYTIQMSTKSGRKRIQDERSATLNQMSEMMVTDVEDPVQLREAKVIKTQLDLQNKLTSLAAKMNSIELSTNQALLDRIKLLQNETVEAQKRLEVSKKSLADSSFDARVALGDSKKMTAFGTESNRLKAAIAMRHTIKTATRPIVDEAETTGENTNAAFARLRMMSAKVKDADLDELIQNLQKSGKAAQLTEDDLSLIVRRLNEIEEASRETMIGLAGDKKAQDAMTDIVNDITDAYEEQVQLQDEVVQKRKDEARQINNFNENLEQSRGKQLEWSDVLVSSANAIAGFTSALSMMGGMWDTLQNPDLSGWEKFTYIMTTLGMLIPTLVTAWTSLKTVISSETLVKIANAVATWGQVVAERALNDTKGQGEKITKDNIKETLSNTKDKVIDGAKNIWGKIKSAPSKIAGKTALKGLGGAVATVGTAAAFIAAASWVYKKADELYNKDENAAKKAEATAKRMEEQAAKTKAKYDELKGSIDSYENSISGLKDLEEGTVEYADAVASANEQALKLIDTYDELAGQYEVTTEGLIVFNEAALDNLQILELQNRNTAQAAALMAKQNAREARTKANTTDFLRDDIEGKNQWSEEDTAILGKGGAIGLGAGAAAGGAVALSGALAGTKLGATFGSFAGPIGTAIGAAAGAIIGLTVGGIVAAVNKEEATRNEKKSIDAISKLYDKIGSAALTKENITKALQAEGITDPALIDSLTENREALEGLMKEIAANTAATRAENEMMARNFAMATDSNFKNYDANMQAAISKAAGARIGMVGARDENNFEAGDYRNTFITTGREIGSEERVDAYLKAQGIDEDDIKRYNFKRDTVMYKYLNKETGKYEKKELDYDDLAAWENAQIVEKDAAKTYNSIKTALFNLAQQDKSGGLIEILGTGDLTSVSKTEIDKLTKAFQSGEFKEELDRLAELTGENYAYTIDQALKSWDYDEALAAYTEKIRGEMEQIFAEGEKETGVSAQALENYSKSLIKTSSALRTYADEWERLDDEKVAASIAVANAKLVKGVQALNEAYYENLEILNEWNEGSLDTWEAVAKVQSALEEAFGLKVSADFVKKNLKEIGELASGDVTNLEELRLKAAQDFVVNLDVSEDSKTLLETYLLELSNRAKDNAIEIGASLDDSSYVESLNKMLEAGQITKEEVQAMFAAIGYSVDLKTTKKKVDNVTSFKYEDQNGNQYTGTYTTTQEIDVPYVAGEDTADPGSDTMGAKQSGTGFTYQGTANTGADLLSKFDQTDDNKKELDRYHYISKTLEDVERQYDAIADARERAFGADKLALYQKEIDKAKEVKDVLQRYADEAKAYYDSDREALLGSSYGIQLDEAGNISNYNDVFAKYGHIENFKELVSNYEDSLTTWKEKLQEVIDKNNELLDLSLEKIQYKIDLAVKIDDQNQEYFDFLMEMADDPLTDAAEKLGYLTDKMNSSTAVAEQMGKSLREALQATGWSDGDINSILAGVNIEELLATNELTETQIEMIEQYRDQLYTTTQMLMTWADDIKDTVVEAFDEMGKAYDESANKLEHYNKILNTYENIIGLIGKDTLGISDSVFGELTQTQVDNAVSLLRVHKEAYETDKAALQQLRDSYDESWSDDAKEAWNEAIKHAEEKVRESEATMFDSWESALQAAADAFEKAVETAVKAYEKAMSGIHSSFDAMQTAYERQTTLNERYLEDYEKIYELSKLNRQVANSIDDTDNVKSKKILKELQDEILELSESEAEVSEYQIGHLQKEYELKMALIALEEAQNAKSQVRMQRDSEGNWSYVYTADEAKVEDAQQNYEDKLFALQEYTQEYIQTNSDALMQLQQEYADAMANIKRENYATQEEYEAALAETTAFYEQMMNYHLDEIGLATTNAQELYEQDWAKYSEMTGYKLSIDKQWIDSWKETPVALTTGLDSITQYQDAFKISSTQMITDLSKAYSDWQTNINTAMDAAGTATDEFAGKVETDTKAIQGYSEKLVSYLDDIGEAAREAFKGVVDAAAKNYADYSDKIADYIARNKDLIASLNEVIKKKVEVENQDTTDVTGNNTGNLSGQGKSPSTDDTDDKYGNGIYSVKADAMNRDGSVDKVVNMSFTADELKTLKRANDGWGAYTAMKDGVEYQLHSDSVRDAMAQAGFYDLYKDRNEFTRTEPSITEKAPQNATDAIGKPVSIPASNKYRQFAFFTDTGKHEYTQTLEGEGIVQEVKQMTNEYGKTAWYYKLSNSNGRWIMASSFDGPLDPSKFDTGGYTGSWGSDGRLALLHQKELVLNADDTRNMLQAVEIVRKIVRVIDLNAANAANAFGMLTATTAMTNDQIIEQEVTIHAEFPNATNHTEIEEAFNSLINRASQFANRKK